MEFVNCTLAIIQIDMGWVKHTHTHIHTHTLATLSVTSSSAAKTLPLFTGAEKKHGDRFFLTK